MEVVSVGLQLCTREIGRANVLEYPRKPIHRFYSSDQEDMMIMNMHDISKILYLFKTQHSLPKNHDTLDGGMYKVVLKLFKPTKLRSKFKSNTTLIWVNSKWVKFGHESTFFRALVILYERRFSINP